ncbi:DUF2806 domain-containing protein [Devosia sp. ZW T5_3]|uniref:DUF2806 domain-containing protein n=1 Tax=Devosia sp. ZW T5_3 TaxID=3378085 RepID=UPI003853139D
MTKCGPDDEVSFGIEVTPNSVTGKAKSRALSVFHRWFGSAMAISIAKNNRAAARERLLGSLEQEAFKEVGAQAIAQLKSNPDAVDAVIEAIAPQGWTRKIENTSAVFEKAAEDLRLNPPTETQSVAGDETMTPEIADRLEQYAAGATTDEVRERWGRVLAAEIRQPGTFSLKVLRIIDELDDRLPAVFERLAGDRLHSDCVPRCLSGELNYTDQIDLIDAGLLHDPGSGGAYQFRMFAEGSENTTGQRESTEVWVFQTDTGTITVPRSGSYSVASGAQEPINSNDGRPGLPSYLLTSAGEAITSILPPVDNAKRYLAALRVKVPNAKLWIQSGTQWHQHDPVPDELSEVGDQPSH